MLFHYSDEELAERTVKESKLTCIAYFTEFRGA